MRTRWIVATPLILVGVLSGAVLLYAWQSKDVVLLYHGRAPEVPQGRVVVIFNPFRERGSERIAERLIRDLRSKDCEQIVRALPGSEQSDLRVCDVLHDTSKESLVWRRDEPHSQMLVYAIPEKRAKLWLVFQQRESGFEVASSLLCVETRLADPMLLQL